MLIFRYHYHANPGSTCPSRAANEQCVNKALVPEQPDYWLGTTYLVGVAADGFPLFVVLDGEGNVVVDDENLDECGGKVKHEQLNSTFF